MKAVRWVIPFQSLKGINYEIRIYDEYTGTVPTSWPITLQGGESPIVTDEDSSEDLFEPVRSVTGTIQVVDMDGTLMEQIVPANNIERPVVMVSNPSSPTPTIELQGFLSCEAYSQDYNGIAKLLDLNFNGVLEAMDSAEFDTTFVGIKQVREVIGKLIEKVETETGMTFYSHLVFSYTAWKAMEKYIDSTVLLDENEQSNEGKTTYEIFGLSCKEVLSRICRFFGWTAREYAQKMYLQRVIDEYKVSSVPVNKLSDTSENFESAMVQTDISEIMMSSLEYRGIGHQKTINQGAKSVEVVSSLDSYNVSVDVPQTMPFDGILESRRTFIIEEGKPASEEGGEPTPAKTAKMYASTNVSFDNRYNFRVFHLDEGQAEVPIIREEGTQRDVFIHSFAGGMAGSEYNDYVGAMMCQLWNDYDTEDDFEYDEIGLLVTAIDTYAYEDWFKDDNTRYIFKSRSVRPLAVASGYLVISPDILLITRSPEHKAGLIRNFDDGDTIQVAIKWGQKYLQEDLTWAGWYHLTTLTCNERKEIRIPIKEFNSGELELYIYPFKIDKDSEEEPVPTYRHYYEYIIKSLEVKYEPRNIIGTEIKENHYFKLINVNFSEKVSINCDFASNLHNVFSPTHLLDDETHLTKVISYVDNSMEQLTYISRRPELDLLRRLASYYVSSRRMVELEIEHISNPLPLLWVRGDYENIQRLFSPLSESRDWKKDISTLTLMEIPDWAEW